jgi:hypothetical protein
VSDELRKIAEHMLLFPAGNVGTETLQKVATVVTDELLILAWEAVRTVSQLQEPAPIGVAQKRLLAWVVAVAVGRPLLTEQAEATKVGNRLKEQAQRVSLKLVGISTRFDALRTAAADQELAEINAAEQRARDEVLTQVYNNAAMLLPTEPVPQDAPVPMLQSELPSGERRQRAASARQAIASEPARAWLELVEGGLEGEFKAGYDAGYAARDNLAAEDTRVNERVAAWIRNEREILVKDLARDLERLELEHEQELESLKESKAKDEEQIEMLQDMLLRAEGREMMLRDLIRDSTTWHDHPRLRDRLAAHGD